MRLAQLLQPRLSDPFGKPKEPRLHVRRKGGDFRGDGFVEDFNPPGHVPLISQF